MSRLRRSFLSKEREEGENTENMSRAGLGGVKTYGLIEP